MYNACTLVPTVFLRHGKTEFKLPVSFFVYPRHRKTEFEILFSFSYYIENGIVTSIFVFRFPAIFYNRILIVISFISLSFCKILKNGIWTSIFGCRFCVFCHFRILPEPEECWHFLSLAVDLETTSLLKSLSAVFLLRKIIVMKTFLR